MNENALENIMINLKFLSNLLELYMKFKEHIIIKNYDSEVDYLYQHLHYLPKLKYIEYYDFKININEISILYYNRAKNY